MQGAVVLDAEVLPARGGEGVAVARAVAHAARVLGEDRTGAAGERVVPARLGEQRLELWRTETRDQRRQHVHHRDEVGDAPRLFARQTHHERHL